MITTAFLLVGLAVAVALSGFFSGAETGIYCLNSVRLRVATEQKQSGAQRLAAMMRRPEQLVITMLLGTNVADYLATAFASALLLHAAVSENLAEVYATLIVTPLILIFGGIIPKDWFRREADRLMYRLALPVEISFRVARLTGLVWVLRTLTHLLARLIDPSQLAEQQAIYPRAATLRLLREGAASGGLTALQRDLMDRVVTMSKTRLSAVMVPRPRAAMVSTRTPREDFLRVARMAHFSRMPAYEDDPRQVTGIINVYDVLTDSEEKPLREYVKEAYRLPQRMSVSRAMLRMQRDGHVMATVEDRQGNCVGLVTIKDLVQQIVGQLEAW